MGQECILLVEDDAAIAEPLRYQLERHGYRVVSTGDGRQALELARQEPPDLVLLDLMLPGLDGLEVCRELRRESPVPVLMMTARGEEMDRVLGLEMGADDYIVKPFSFRELLARVRANLRRVALDTRRVAGPLELDALRVDLDRRTVTREGEPVALSFREFELLRALVLARGAVCSRECLLDTVWGPDWVGDPRTVDVHVRWLREKLERDAAHPRLLLTSRGAGYRLVTPDELVS